MATKLLLAELANLWKLKSGIAVTLESVGGVLAAKRVRDGEAFDGVVLASDAIASLVAEGFAVAGSQTDLVHSYVAVAVKAGAPVPDISTEVALRRAIDAATTVGYSTGPSGVALVKLFEQWGMSASVAARTVQVPPGIPVGELVARGDVALGFQQLSELMGLSGITLAGLLPEPVSITTVFTAAVCTASSKRQDMTNFFKFLASADAAAIKQRCGMSAA